MRDGWGTAIETIGSRRLREGGCLRSDVSQYSSGGRRRKMKHN